MSKFDDHPTVKRVREQTNTTAHSTPVSPLDADWLRNLCLEAGAEDVGFVEINRPEIADQRREILAAFPSTKTLISFVCCMNRENVRTPARSIANQEFHATYDSTNEVAHQVVATLERIGIRAMNPAAGFPIDISEKW